MVATGHTAIGVIIGITAYNLIGQNNLVAGLIVCGGLGVVTHYLFDAIPHGHFFSDKDLKKKIKSIIILDVLLPIVLFLFSLYLKDGLTTKLFYVLFAIGGSQLPDVIDGLIYTDIIKPISFLKHEIKFHQIIHWHSHNPNVLLISIIDIWQVLIVLFAFFFVHL